MEWFEVTIVFATGFGLRIHMFDRYHGIKVLKYTALVPIRKVVAALTAISNNIWEISSQRAGYL